MGSTSLTLTANGGFYSELRYMPWGGNRYTAGTTPTTFRYTDQREAEAGLSFSVVCSMIGSMRLGDTKLELLCYN